MNRRSSFLAMLAMVAGCVASSCSQANDEADVNASVQHLVAAVNAKDLNGIMAYYSPDESLFVFDALPPRQYVGAAAYRKNWEGFLAAYPGALHAEVTDWKTETEGSLAYGHGIFRTTGPDKDGTPQGASSARRIVYGYAVIQELVASGQKQRSLRRTARLVKVKLSRT